MPDTKLFRRGEPAFMAFDLLSDKGIDLRPEQLLDRKAALRRLLNQFIEVGWADACEGIAG